jgi:hypothetical protein
MRAEELRIGNYVYVDYEIKQFKMSWFDDHVNFEEEFKPIPLTDELLLRLGFELNECDNYELAYIVEINSTFTIIDEERGYFYIDARNNEIKYLHQLQNLYFALTNKELEIL